MPLHKLAGQPTPPALLIDPAVLEAAYFTQKPDASNPLQQVSFGTSGHRGTPLDGSLFRDAWLGDGGLESKTSTLPCRGGLFAEPEWNRTWSLCAAALEWKVELRVIPAAGATARTLSDGSSGSDPKAACPGGLGNRE